MEDDVVRLPLAWRPRGIDERGILAVDRACLAVGIGVVLIGIEHLELVYPHQEDAAVAALLPFALHDGWRGPLDVQLYVAEAARRDEHAGAGLYLDVAILHGPFGRGAVLRAPLGQVRAVEQHDRVA